MGDLAGEILELVVKNFYIGTGMIVSRIDTYGTTAMWLRSFFGISFKF